VLTLKSKPLLSKGKELDNNYGIQQAKSALELLQEITISQQAELFVFLIYQILIHLQILQIGQIKLNNIVIHLFKL